MRTFRHTITSVATIALVAGATIAVAAQSDDPESVPGSGIATPPQLVMGPPTDRYIGGWREIARSETGAPIEQLIGAIGDRLVAQGNVCEAEDGPCADFAWSSPDGMTWSSTALEGIRPSITDSTATAEGLVAVGYSFSADGTQQAAIWATADGAAWTGLPAPRAEELDAVVALDGAILVSSGARVWSSTDGSAWVPLEAPAATIVAGPGGLLASSGGGQDLVKPTALWHSADGHAWNKVRLPRALRGATGEVSLFGMDDGWVMIPSAADLPKAILTSPDGLDWQRAARPPKMVLDGYIFWLDEVGGSIQAFGGLNDDKSGLWTWQPGDGVSQPAILRDERIGAPIEWLGDQVALATGTAADGAATLLRWEPETPTPPTASIPLENAAGAQASLDIFDDSGMLVSARSGQPGEGASVMFGEVVVSNDSPTTLQLTWTDGPCDATDTLTIDETGTRLLVVQPPCEGDSIPFDRVLILEFSSPIDAADVQASLEISRDPAR